MSQDRLRTILAEVVKIDEHVAAFVAAHPDAFAAVDARYQRSAENLLHYVGLRQLELRKLQLELGEWGLSSLGRCEGHVRSSLRELRARLEDSLAIVRSPAESSAPALSRAAAEQLLHAHTRALLGEQPSQRHVSIMVTADDVPPSEEACATLITAGMDVLRINTAHGSPDAWHKIAAVVREVATRMKRSVTIHVDLEGPKIRTAAMREGPAVVRYRPQKDALGRVVRELRVPIVGVGTTTPDADVGVLPLRVPDAWIPQLRVGDVLATVDARERRRRFHICEVGPGAAVGELDRTCFLTPECRLVWKRDGETRDSALVTGVAPLRSDVPLQVGDEVQLWLDGSQGAPGVRHPTDTRSWLVPPRIGLHLDQATLARARSSRTAR